MGIDAGGANDYIGGLEGEVFGGFEDALKDAAQFLLSPGVEARRVDVGIDGEAAGEIVFLGDQFGAAPAEEIAFDGIAIGMGADGAPAGVMGEIGGCALHHSVRGPADSTGAQTPRFAVDNSVRGSAATMSAGLAVAFASCTVAVVSAGWSVT